MVKKSISKKRVAEKDSTKSEVEVLEDYSFNNCLLRGRVSAPATDKELPSGEHVVEFRLIISREKRDGVDTLDIASWSAKNRRTALSFKGGEWVEVSGAIRRRFWQSPTGLASRWQIESESLIRL
jgi:single-strand DNA-binding protein